MRRLAPLGAAVLASALGALAMLSPAAPVAPACAAAGPHHAAVVVEHGDGTHLTRCVAFSGDTISGEDLLNQSGVAWSSQTFGGFGDAVCALDGEPAHYSACPGKDNYWAVFVAPGGGSWQLANVGISSLQLRDGDAEGFRYVPAVGVAAAPVTVPGVCGSAAVASSSAVPLAPKAIPSPGLDTGLVVAVGVGGALALLAVGRLVAGRRSRT